MEIQTIIVAVIILITLIYVGKMLFAKVKAFSSKSDCGNDCGCDSKLSKTTQIRRS